MKALQSTPTIAVACGGTGGHLFPGLAVADVLQQWGCDLALLVSQKEVDQEAVKSAAGMKIIALPAVALQQGRVSRFANGFWQSYKLCRTSFESLRPAAVLAMGGFTSAPPILAGKRIGAATSLHESNSIPGRANRWLAPWVDEVFVGFPTAGRRLSNQCIRLVGTPIRSQFKPCDPAPCRMALGLQPNRPVLLTMGGSQGARGINQLLIRSLPNLAAQAPDLQYLHITGANDLREVQSAYAAHSLRAVVRPFLTEMDLALGSATVVVNRAGASSLAELAAVQVPAVLIPYPHATDNHQTSNAQALVRNGAARLMEESDASPELLANLLVGLLNDPAAQAAMRAALQQWHFPHAADEIAGYIFKRLGLPKPDIAFADESGPIGRPVPVLRRNWTSSKLQFATSLSKSP